MTSPSAIKCSVSGIIATEPKRGVTGADIPFLHFRLDRETKADAKPKAPILARTFHDVDLLHETLKKGQAIRIEGTAEPDVKQGEPVLRFEIDAVDLVLTSARARKSRKLVAEADKPAEEPAQQEEAKAGAAPPFVQPADAKGEIQSSATSDRNKCGKEERPGLYQMLKALSDGSATTASRSDDFAGLQLSFPEAKKSGRRHERPFDDDLPFAAEFR